MLVIQTTLNAIHRRAHELGWSNEETIRNILLAIQTCGDPGIDPAATLKMITEVMDRWDGVRWDRPRT